MSKLSIRDLSLNNKRIFMRVDFNVPLAAGGQEITSDKRIKASLFARKALTRFGAGLCITAVATFARTFPYEAFSLPR